MSEEKLYFAYGSNINLNQMAFRCPNATPVCPVTLDNYELTFSGGGVATIVPAEGKQVPGLLWELTPECERALDHYEGFPHYYDKEQITVTDNVAVVCNEEGKLMGLPPNRYLRDDRNVPYDVICGTFFVAGLSEDSFTSLTKEQAAIYSNMYSKEMLISIPKDKKPKQHER